MAARSVTVLCVAASAATAILGACAGPPPHALTGEALPRPETLRYEQRILDWAAGFFAEPESIRSAEISTPVPYVFGQASAWLVCVGYDVRARGGDYLGYRRLAFGVGTGSFFPPLGRGHNVVRNEVCDTLPLSWRPFPALETLARRRPQS